jgi:mevalonate kinase
MEIKKKKIIEENDRYVQNLQGALEKEQKFKVELQDMNNENSKVLVELKVVKQKIANI